MGSGRALIGAALGQQLLYLLALVSIVLVPIWWIEFVPTVDGSVHLYIVHIMRSYASSPMLQEYFTWNPNIEPNSAIYLLFYGLSEVFSLPVAEKVFISAWAFLYALAALYAARAVHAPTAFVSALIVPTMFTQLLHMGFYNYNLSIVVFLFVFGWWFRHRRTLQMRGYVAFGLMSLALVCTHLVGLLVLMITCAGVLAADLIGDWYQRRRPPLASLLITVRRGLLLLLAWAPALIIVGSFLVRYGTSEPLEKPHDIARLLGYLASFAHFYSFSKNELLLFAPIILLIVGGVAFRLYQWLVRRAVDNGDRLILALALLVLVYLFIPLASRGVPVAERLLPFIFALVVLSLSPLAAHLVARRAIVVVAIVTTLATTGYRLAVYHAYQRMYDDYRSLASSLESGRTLLPIEYNYQAMHLPWGEMTWRVNPPLHFGTRVALETGLIVVNEALLSPHAYGYFPIVYRAAYDGHAKVDMYGERQPQMGAMPAYEACTPGQVDYVIAWREDDIPSIPEDIYDARTHALIQAGFRPIATSQPLGWAKLYARDTSRGDWLAEDMVICRASKAAPNGH
ncbi:MAG: hypothetical protein ACFB3T_05495 [Geminicoccaceae bacterium]